MDSLYDDLTVHNTTKARYYEYLYRPVEDKIEKGKRARDYQRKTEFGITGSPKRTGQRMLSKIFDSRRKMSYDQNGQYTKQEKENVRTIHMATGSNFTIGGLKEQPSDNFTSITSFSPRNQRSIESFQKFQLKK